MDTLPRLALVPGEPAGVGPELCLRLAEQPLASTLLALADPQQLRAAAALTASDVQVLEIAEGAAPPHRPGVLCVRPIAAAHAAVPGHPDPRNVPYLLACFAAAAHGCLDGSFDAMVTGPVQKSSFHAAGVPFTGVTELLSAHAGHCDVVMMLSNAAPAAGLVRAESAAGLVRAESAAGLVRAESATGLARARPANGLADATRSDTDLPDAGSSGAQPLRPGMRVALATTHLALRDVADAITADRLERVVRVLHAALRRDFGLPAPRIAVLGLNPHAGEDGNLGREELDIIGPTLERLRAEGLQLAGPLPADTAFLPHRLADTDAVLAMYHDQGLPVLKYSGFERAVNITLGLPFIRVAVDHGTALDLAGTGRADPSSLIAATTLAATLARQRRLPSL